MKILHTADWHLGKVLHQFDLEEDHRLFISWLLDFIETEKIDVLIISGDVFDQGNPSNEARKLLNLTLRNLIRLGTRVIITGGNHDSINMLNASKELLEDFNVTMIGGVPENFGDQIIELQDKEGNIELICAAIPFLRDKDLKSFVSGENYDDRIKAIKQGITNHYHKIIAMIDEKYQKQYPVLGMGHLYIQGATLPEGEKEIQLGNAAGIESSTFDGLFDYFALGHIHVPLRYGNNVRYSGSPIPLSFSEKNDEKIVIIVEVVNGKLINKSYRVPRFREVIQLSGNWEVVKEKITGHKSDSPLPPIYELLIIANAGEIYSIENECNEMKNAGYLIIKKRYQTDFNESPLSSLLQAEEKSITELNPREVFAKKLEGKIFEIEDLELIHQAYEEVLTELNETE